MENKAGINNEKLTVLIKEIYDTVENVNNILNQVSDAVDRSKKCYNCSNATSYTNMYDDFKTNYNIILNNMKSYAVDFTNLINSYQNKDAELKQELRLKSIDIENMYGVGEYNEHR